MQPGVSCLPHAPRSPVDSLDLPKPRVPCQLPSELPAVCRMAAEEAGEGASASSTAWQPAPPQLQPLTWRRQLKLYSLQPDAPVWVE